jgi:hypothetical protein
MTTEQIELLARSETLVPNWTGLNAAQLWQEGRLTDETLKRWANDAANKHADKWFDAEKLSESMAGFDAFKQSFIQAAKSA